MRSLVFMACCVLLVFVSAADAQTAQNDVYTIGAQKVRIPAPAGFTDVFRFERMAGRFTSSEAPGNIALAAHAPIELLPRMEAGDEPALGYYTKVSVPKQYMSMDITPAMFPALAAEVQKQFPTVIKPDGPVMGPAIANAEKGLTKHWGTDPGFDIKEPKYLGYFDKTSSVFSGLMLMNVQVFGRTDPIVTSFSLVNVKNRIVFVYVYRIFTSEKDADIVRDFTKKWTAAIVAANIPPPPPAPKKR